MNSKSNIINGKIYAEKVLEDLRIEIKCATDRIGFSPQLAIVLVGEDPASIIYVRNKLKAASQVGIEAFKVHLPSSVTQEELIQEINKLNINDRISGIIVQLPLPVHIDKNIILSTVVPDKDVDGFHPVNVGRLHSGDSGSGFVPATPLGILSLIKRLESNLSGKNVVILGRSNIVGKPLSALLLNEDCTVTICHSKTRDLALFTSKADIVISAVGKPKFLNEAFFNSNSIVIDVGINRDSVLEKIVGDVDFEKVQPIVKYITPVPGGVGPMTIAFLLINSFKAFLKQNHPTNIENE